MEVATGNLEFSVSGYTDLAVIPGAGSAPTAAIGVGPHTGHAARNDAHPVLTLLARGRPKQQEGGLWFLPHSKSLVRVSALDHSELSAPAPQRASPRPPQAPLDVAVWGALVWAGAGPAAAPAGSRSCPPPIQCCRLPGPRPHCSPVSWRWHPSRFLPAACLQATFPPSYTSECFLTRILKFNVLCMSKEYVLVFLT